MFTLSTGPLWLHLVYCLHCNLYNPVLVAMLSPHLCSTAVVITRPLQARDTAPRHLQSRSPAWRTAWQRSHMHCLKSACIILVLTCVNRQVASIGQEPNSAH